MSDQDPARQELVKREQRTCHALATLGLFLVACLTVAAVCYAAVIEKDPSAVTLLATLATGSLSALIVLSGGKRNDQ